MQYITVAHKRAFLISRGYKNVWVKNGLLVPIEKAPDANIHGFYSREKNKVTASKVKYILKADNQFAFNF